MGGDGCDGTILAPCDIAEGRLVHGCDAPGDFALCP